MAAAVLLALAPGLPLAVLVAELLAAGVLDSLATTLGAWAPWGLLARTAGLAAGVTMAALLVGVPMGAALARGPVAGRHFALLVHLFPVFLPPFLLAFGWFRWFGRQGLLGSAATSSLLFGPLGVLGTLGLAFAPVVTALTVLGLHGVDPSLEEAARASSRPLRTLTHILLPLAWPAMGLGALIVYALAVSEIGVPMFLGVRTYSTAVFARLGGVQYAPGEAAALVLPLLLLGMALVLVERRLLGRRSFAALGPRRSGPAPPVPGRGRLLATLLVWGLCGLSLLPLAALALEAGAHGLVEAGDWIGRSLSTSLFTSACAATVMTAMGLILGHALARGRRAGSVLDAVAMLAFLTPSAALGVGLVTAYNRPIAQGIYASSAILVVGLVARYAVVGVRTLAAVFYRSAPHYEEAAAAFGAGFFRRLVRILVPMHWQGVLGAWLIAFVFCLRDLDTVVVFYPPGLEPLPVRIFTLEANGPEPVIAGLSLLHVAATAAVLTAGGLLMRTRGRR